MYEAVPKCITPTHCSSRLTCTDAAEYDGCAAHDDDADADAAPARRVRGASASPAHTCGTHTPSRGASSSGGSGRVGGGDGGATTTPHLVHLDERNRAHRVDERNAHAIVAASSQLLTHANAATAERDRSTPVMEQDLQDVSASRDANGCAHPEWAARNGSMQRRADDACTERVDVDQIKLEQHYRPRTKTTGVQTTHLSPYRLRFWPVAASIKCLDASFVDVLKCCLRTLSQWFLSQVGLTCVLLVWALLGATAFYQTEGPREREQAEQISHYKVDISVDMATELRQLKEGSDKWSKTIQKYLNKHESLLLQAVSSGYVKGGGSIWTYPGCVLFAVLLLTTLGFGAPVPRTPLGRGMAVLFSAVGIPLHFMLIINASSLIAKCLRNLATIKPVGEMHESITKRRHWYKWFPPVVAVLYYILGVICFGVLRQRSVVECLMFALDFTESGGVANTAGHVRILYALYIEIAVVLAATIMSIVQVSATHGIIDLGLRLGLLTNT